MYNDFVKFLCIMYQRHGSGRWKNPKEKKELNTNDKPLGYPGTPT